MAEQLQRVGLLKAVGGTPVFVAGVLLADYLGLALVGAAAGLAAGRLAAPLLIAPGAGLLGTAGAPSLTLETVVGVAIAVAVLATFIPALRAARTSTVRALADAARPPRRRAWLIGRSARLPVSLLLAVRLGARRPRRIVLSVLSIAVTVSGIVALLFAHATLAVSHFGTSAGSANPARLDVGFASRTTREDQEVWTFRYSEPRGKREPAASLVAGRRRARHRDRRGGPHLHSGPHRRPPTRGRDSPGRNRLIASTAGNGPPLPARRAAQLSTAGRDAKIDWKALSQRVGHAAAGDSLSLVAIEDEDATNQPMRPDHNQGGTKIPFTNPFTGCMQKAPSMIGRGLWPATW